MVHHLEGCVDSRGTSTISRRAFDAASTNARRARPDFGGDHGVIIGEIVEVVFNPATSATTVPPPTYLHPSCKSPATASPPQAMDSPSRTALTREPSTEANSAERASGLSMVCGD